MSPCKHLLAPLVPIPDGLEAMNLRRFRVCEACGDALWEDGSPLEYVPDAPDEVMPI